MSQELSTLFLQENQMEELLFYQYLEYQKANSTPFTQRLFGFPPAAILLSLGTLVSAAIGICLLCINRQDWATLAAIVEFICCFGFELYIEHFQIVHSKVKAEKRFSEWYRLKDWLAETPASGDDKITEIKKRIEQRVKSENAARKKTWMQIEKWGQLLAFPLVVVAATKIIDAQSDVASIIVIIFAIFTICFLFYGLIRVSISVWSFVKIRRLKQMTFFAEDLQGVLDLEQFGIERATPDQKTVSQPPSS